MKYSLNLDETLDSFKEINQIPLFKNPIPLNNGKCFIKRVRLGVNSKNQSLFI